eukprot:375990-Hanusia_phi.AAC.1
MANLVFFRWKVFSENRALRRLTVDRSSNCLVIQTFLQTKLSEVKWLASCDSVWLVEIRIQLQIQLDLLVDYEGWLTSTKLLSRYFDLLRAWQRKSHLLRTQKSRIQRRLWRVEQGWTARRLRPVFERWKWQGKLAFSAH